MCVCVCVCVCSVMSDSLQPHWLQSPQTVAHQAPLSMGFSRKEYWSGLPIPPPGDLPDPGIKPVSFSSPALRGRFFITSTTWEAWICESVQFSSVQFSCSVVSNSLRSHESQHARPPCPSPSPGVHSDSRPSSHDAIQPSHPLSSPSSPAPNPSQRQRLFQWVNSSHEVAKVLEFQL